MAGRATPLMRPMRSSALAMVAPVLPALTMAEARPSRTASAARTREESFMRRTLAPASASMAMTSEAGEDLEVAGVADLVGSADQQDRHAELGGGLLGPGDDGVGGVVAAHGVDGDREHGGHGVGRRVGISRRRWPGGRGTSRSCRTRCGAAWWLRTAGRCCGAAVERVQAEARRLRLLDFDVFFLGTAMVLGASMVVRIGERRPRPGNGRGATDANETA